MKHIKLTNEIFGLGTTPETELTKEQISKVDSIIKKLEDNVDDIEIISSDSIQSELKLGDYNILITTPQQGRFKDAKNSISVNSDRIQAPLPITQEQTKRLVELSSKLKERKDKNTKDDSHAYGASVIDAFLDDPWTGRN